MEAADRIICCLIDFPEGKESLLSSAGWLEILCPGAFWGLGWCCLVDLLERSGLLGPCAYLDGAG